MKRSSLTFGEMISRTRGSTTLAIFAKRLGVSPAYLCDIEKDRRKVSLERSVEWAKMLGISEVACLQLVIQGQLDARGVNYRVTVKAR